MTTNDEQDIERDETLERAFSELRRSDASRAPRFETMWRRRPAVWWVAAIPALAVAAVLAFWIAQPHTEPRVFAAPAPRTELPLDFLLEQPNLASAAEFDIDPVVVERR